jgi:RNA recognition motif-containing protein
MVKVKSNMEISMKKLFVGNLAWKVTEDSLKSLFEAFGKVVSIKIITDQYTGKSKGFGFVEMESADAAEKAMKELNDKPVMDRNLRVSLAQERREGNGGPGGSSGGQRSFRSRSGGDRNYEPRGGYQG